MNNKETLGGHTSIGHRMSNADFIDAHYATCRNSYEAMLRAVGIQPGWHVLDAGCGSGSFLPLMAELVGPNGKIDAFDLAPENIDRVKSVVQGWDVPVLTEVGSLTELPYDDNTFDAIWSANVTQYFTDHELTQMLNELVRVVKPGGFVAIKESDWTTTQFYPLDTYVFWRLFKKNPHLSLWAKRTLNLPSWIKSAGLVEVSPKTFLEEIRPPLPEIARSFLAGALQFFAKEAEDCMMSEADMEHWRRCRELDSPDNPVNQADFYFRDGHTLVVGKKPPSN